MFTHKCVCISVCLVSCFFNFFFFLHLKQCTRLYVCVYVCVCVCHKVCVQSVCGFYSQVRPCLLAARSTLRVWPAAMPRHRLAQCCEHTTNYLSSISFPIRNVSIVALLRVTNPCRACTLHRSFSRWRYARQTAVHMF